MNARSAVLVLLACAALAGCTAARPLDAERPGVTTQGSGGSAGTARGRVGLRFPLPP
ncbi:MAG: hypothetical protein JNL66_16985 [Alphaproteobacteria bacterium]|nr:hypothetical protein [Alphaproteobacteria bacterium]